MCLLRETLRGEDPPNWMEGRRLGLGHGGEHWINLQVAIICYLTADPSYYNCEVDKAAQGAGIGH